LNINNIEIKPFDLYKISSEVSNDIKSIDVELFDYIDFNKIIYNKFDKLNLKPKTYITIHIRLGDKYLEIKSINNLCPNHSKINDNISKNIDKIIKGSNETIYLLSDNKNIKQEYKNKYNQIKINDIDIYHIGLDYKNYKDDIIINTLVEYLILMNSKEIHGITTSGFAFTASILGKIKYITY